MKNHSLTTLAHLLIDEAGARDLARDQTPYDVMVDMLTDLLVTIANTEFDDQDNGASMVEEILGRINALNKADPLETL